MNKITSACVHPIHPRSSVVKSEGLFSASVDGEVVIFSPRQRRYYTLNSTASHVWTLLDSSPTVSAVRDAMVAEYDVDPARCEMEVVALLQNLLMEQLIQVTG